MTFPVFSTGDVLPASDMNAIGLWLVNQSTVSNQTEIVFNNVFTSSFDQYRVVFRLTGASATQSIYYRNRVGGVEAATNYETFSSGYRPTNAAATVASSVVGTTFLFLAGSTTADFASGSFDIFSPQKPTITQMAGNLIGVDGTSSYSLALGGRHTTATAYDGFRIYASTGTFSGTCRVYGYRN